MYAAHDMACFLPGKGSYGSVYEARIKDTEERVAIKVIPVGENDDIEEIQKEIDMLKECDHPNVVHYLVRNLCIYSHNSLKSSQVSE